MVAGFFYLIGGTFLIELDFFAVSGTFFFAGS